MNRLVVLTGPSGIGKTPLSKALGLLYPHLAESLTPLVLFNSRDPRPGEQDGIDYYFRPAEEIRSKRNRDDFFVFEVRGDTQGLDLRELRSTLQEKSVFYEGNPFVGKALVSKPHGGHIPTVSVFVSPLSADEILFFSDNGVDIRNLVTDLMRRKLLRRTRAQKGELALPDLENIERRAQSAFRELCMARHFEYIIPNHDGEESDHWQGFKYPLGDARRAVTSFAGLLQEESSPGLERWGAEVFARLEEA
jgi:guanylate kinase